MVLQRTSLSEIKHYIPYLMRKGAACGKSLEQSHKMYLFMAWVLRLAPSYFPLQCFHLCTSQVQVLFCPLYLEVAENVRGHQVSSADTVRVRPRDAGSIQLCLFSAPLADSRPWRQKWAQNCHQVQRQPPPPEAQLHSWRGPAFWSAPWAPTVHLYQGFRKSAGETTLVFQQPLFLSLLCNEKVL